MSIRKARNGIIVAVVVGSTACGTADPGTSGADDAAGDARPDVAGNGPDDAADASPEKGEADEAREAATPDANDDRAEIADAKPPTDEAADGGRPDVGTSDSNDASEASVVADANGDGDATADANDSGPDQPSEVAYVATYLGGISAFSIDTKTGALGAVPGSPFDPGGGFYAIAVTKSGQFAYAADYLHDTVNGYRIARSGALQPVPSSPVNMAGKPVGLTVDPADRFVFAGTSDGSPRIFVHRIDEASGALTPVEDSPFATTDEPATLAVDPQSRFLFVSSRVAAGVRVFAIGDPSGALTEVPGSPFGAATVQGGGIAFSQVGQFVYNGGNGVNAFRYDITSGAMTAIDGSPFGQALSDSTAVNIATDSEGGYVFAVHTFLQTLSAFTMDQGTGRLSRIPQSPFSAAPSPYSIGVDPSDRFAFVGNDDADEVSVFSIEATPGDGLRHVAGSPFVVHGLQPEFAFVRFQQP